MDLLTALFPALSKDGRLQQFPSAFLRLEEILLEQLPKILFPAVPADLPELEQQGRRLLEQLRTLVLSPALRRKTVVGLGGCFSSGKSSLANALLGHRLLPTEIVPTTAVPTYVVQGEEEQVTLCNRFYAKDTLTLEALRQITHGYYDSEESLQPLELSHLVRDLCLHTPRFAYPNLALLDTPGFTGERDAGPVRDWLNSANALIWVVNAEAGSLTGEELRFLRQLDPGMEKLFVLNKCDKKTNSDVARIKRQVLSTLEQNGIPHAGLAAYSCRRREDYDGAMIQDFLCRWDREQPLPALPEAFYGLFWQYLDQVILSQRTVNRRLNRLHLLPASPETEGTLADLIRELQSDRQALQEQQHGLETLQALFFAALEELGREIGCPLPQPAGQAPAALRCDPIRLLREQKQAREIPNGDAKYRILMSFSGIVPTMSSGRGGAQRTNVTAAKLEQLLDLPDTPAFVRDLQGERFAARIRKGLFAPSKE